MATLVLRYPCNETSGSLAEDIISGDDMTINSVGIYPKRVTDVDGTGAYEFNGANGTSFPYYDAPLATCPSIYIPKAARTVGCTRSWTMAARVKIPFGPLPGARPIFGTVTYPSNSRQALGRGGEFLYITYDGRPAFYVQHYSFLTRVTVAVTSPTAILDDEWHTIVGTYEDATNLGTGERRKYLNLYVDKQLVATHTVQSPPDAYIYEYDPGRISIGPNSFALAIGAGSTNDSSYPLPGVTETGGRVSSGSFLGAIDECRLYCGIISNPDFKPPSKISSIMFSCNT